MRRLLRSTSLLLLASCWMACGLGEDDAAGMGPDADGPAICNLRDLAVTLVSDQAPCPPERCAVDTEAGTTSCQGQAAVSGGQACTRMVLTGAACKSTCTPPACSLGAGGAVRCTPGCSPDDTTCFSVAADACAPN